MDRATTLHHHLGMLQERDDLQRVALHHHEIRPQDAVTFPDSVELKAAPLDAVMKVAGGAPQ